MDYYDKTISLQQKEAILEKIYALIEETGFCSCPILAGYIKNTLMIDWNVYAEGKKFPDWICNMFPQFKRDYDEPNHLVPQSSAEVPYALVAKLSSEIDKAIAEQGFCFCARLGNVIPWKDYQLSNENFPAFLKRILPAQYRIDLHNNAEAVFRKNDGPDPMLIPKPIPSPKKSTRMQEGVFAFAYIPANTEFTRAIQQLASNASITIGTWRDAVIQAIGEYLLGERTDFYDDTAGDNPRMAFPLVIEGKKTIYAILEKNTPGQRQAWRLAGFTYPGNDDANGWGKWLCSAFSLPTENHASVISSIGVVEETLSQVNQLRNVIVQEIEELRILVEGGRPITMAIRDSICSYYSLWDTLQNAANNAFIDIPDKSLLSIDSISGVLRSKTDASLQIEEIFSHFKALARGVWEYLGQISLCDNVESGIAHDCAVWQDISSAGSNNLSQLKDNLKVYSAFSALAHPVNDLSAIAELEAPKRLVEEHFGVAISPMDLVSKFIMASQLNSEAFAFLDEIQQIENMFAIVETSNDSIRKVRNVTQAASESRLSGISLLKSVLAGERPFGSIIAAYPSPSELDIAIMEGDYSKAVSMINANEDQSYDNLIESDLAPMTKVGDSLSPYYAGLRLAVVMKNQNQQAERCFLAALATGNSMAAQGLYIIYSNEGRLEEMELLLDYARSKQLNNLTPKIIEKLLENGRVDCRNVAQSDVLMILNQKYWETLQEQDSELYEIVQKISMQTTNAFVRYVIYHDDQLRDYILLQDNIAFLNQEGICKSGEELLGLIQTGNYPKGSDALSVAQRCYAFLGNWNGLAELFLAIIPASSDTRSLLLEIAKDQGDTKRMVEILDEDSLLRERYSDTYTALLFDSCNYEKFLLIDNHCSIKHVIAEIRLGVWNGVLPERSDVIPEDYRLLRELLNSDEMESISCSAIRDNDVCLAYYTMENPPENIVSEVEAHVEALMTELSTESQFETVGKELHRVEVLCPTVFSKYQNDIILKLIVRTLTANGNIENAAELIELVQRVDNPQMADSLFSAIEHSDKRETLCNNYDVVKALKDMCEKMNCIEKWILFCHDNINVNHLQYADILTSAYTDLMLNDNFPNQLLASAEENSLLWFSLNHDVKSAFCLLMVEGKQNHTAKQVFILKYLESKIDVLSELEKATVHDQIEALGDLFEQNELALLRMELSDSTSKLEDYLRFCRAFNLFTEDDATTSRMITRSYATELEANSLLHLLYKDFPSVESAKAALKLPLYDYPRLYAQFALELCSAVSDTTCQADTDVAQINNLWKTCSNYCLENELFDLQIITLKKWSQSHFIHSMESLKWYHMKELFAAVERTCASTEETMNWDGIDESTSKLIDNLIVLFDRFNSISDGDANHNSLRALINIAISSKNEAIILNSNAVISAIYGPYKKLGFVLAIKLLRSNEDARAEVALNILRNLDRIGDNLPWHWLIHQILEFSKNELDTWLSSDVGQCLIDLALPDGNEVNEDKIHALVMRYADEESNENGIAVLNTLLNEKDDCMVYNALFVLCKEAPLKNIALLYKSLCGMIATYPVNNGRDKTFLFSRRRVEMVKLAIVARVVMVKTGMCEQVAVENENPQFFRDIYQYGANGAWKTDISTFVNDQQKLYDKIMRLYDGNSTDVVTLALTSCVAGNWIPFLENAWESHRDDNLRPLFAMCCARGNEVELPNLGLKRSCMLFMKRRTQADRIQFVHWLQSFMPNGDTSLPRLYGICKELSLISGDLTVSEKSLRFYDIDTIQEDFLTLPLEEHLICIGTWNNSSFSEVVDVGESREIHSCFDWMRSNTPPSRLAVTINLFFSLAQDATVGTAVTRYANTLFTAGKDDYAQAYYDALHYATTSAPYRKVQRIAGVSLLQKNSVEVEELQRQWSELYESRYRISGVFSGQPAVLLKVGNERLKKHSVFNMVMELLSTGRRNELYSLCKYYHVSNRQFAIDLLKCVSSDVNDEEKLQIRSAYELGNRNNLGANELVTFLLSRKNTDIAIGKQKFFRDPGNTYGNYVYVKSMVLGDRLHSEFEESCADRYVPVLLWPGVAYNTATLQQTEEAPSFDADDLVIGTEVNRITRISGAEIVVTPQNLQSEKKYFVQKAEQNMPGFVLDTGFIEVSSEATEDVSELINQYDLVGITSFEKRLQLSRSIYIAQKNTGTEKEINNSIARFGIDLYLFHRSGLDGAQPALADKALRELALWAQRKTIDRKQTSELGSTVATALIRILGSYSSVEDLMDDFAANLNGYLAMASLSDVQHIWLNDIVNILSAHTKRISKLGSKSENEEAYRAVYSELAEQLLGFTTERGLGREAEVLKTKLHRIIHTALNELENRPDLTVTVHNEEGRGLPNDAVYGEVTNVSSFAIESITLIFSWTEGSKHFSNEYNYYNLQPQTRVAFCLEYTSGGPGSIVNYSITTVATVHGKQLNIAPVNGNIMIEDIHEYEIGNDFYTANRAIDFFVENGNIVPTSGFFGREVQMATLRKNISVENFSRSNNQLIRGRRRSGKTSLLKYFATYCRFSCEEALTIFVDCQGTDVSSVFVTPVLNHLSLNLSELNNHSEWLRFEQRWRDPSSVDCKVGEFYEELKLLLSHLNIEGKFVGIFLILDEFAQLLESLEKTSAIKLLQMLRSIMEHCGDIVKFTFCSSNQILKYKGKDGAYSQFFQAFQEENGTEIIVDDLTADGIRELLTKPCEKIVEIPQYSLEWFYRYTGGLVWYTKLLGNAVLSRVCKKHSQVIYPSDVVEAFSGICNPNNCDVFYEGCSDNERLLISALADMLPNYRAGTIGISEQDILTSLETSKQMTGDAFKNSLEILHSLKLVDSPNGASEMHRFNKEIYRRYFRSRKITSAPTASDSFTLKVAMSSSDLYGDLSFLG